MIEGDEQASMISGENESMTLQGHEGKEQRKYQLLSISEKGQLEVHMEFVHWVPHGRDSHLYITPSRDKMIELIINPFNKSQYEYLFYNWIANSWDRMYEKELLATHEWHEHSLFPYTMNPETLEEVVIEGFQDFDVY